MCALNEREREIATHTLSVDDSQPIERDVETAQGIDERDVRLVWDGEVFTG